MSDAEVRPIAEDVAKEVMQCLAGDSPREWINLNQVHALCRYVIADRAPPATPVAHCSWCPNGEPLVKFHPDGGAEHRRPTLAEACGVPVTNFVAPPATPFDAVAFLLDFTNYNWCRCSKEFINRIMKEKLAVLKQHLR